MMKRSMVLTVLFITLFAAHASHAAEPIGRLFSTPTERDELDGLRQLPKAIKQQAKKVPVLIKKLKPKPLPNKVHVQGYVKRSDGKQGTVWVNGKAMQESSRNKDVQVGKLPANSNRVPIRIKANGKRISLKAGQVYEPAKNRIRESRTSVQGDSGRIGD